VHVPVQPLLENSSAQIVGLPLHDFTNCDDQRRITDARFPCRPAEPGSLESPRRRFSWHGEV
jgi:hypothetical protein